MTTGLVYVGKVLNLAPIDGADRIEQCDVVCGSGGKWHGVVGKGDFSEGSLCRVYLHDCQVPQTPEFDFMARYKYRVRMQRLRGVPSEVLIMKAQEGDVIGTDITLLCNVTKYEKAIPSSLWGLAKGLFPAFLPKTDEPNFQRAAHLVSTLGEGPVYVTEKADGTSATFYKKDGVFGVCSRNLELVDQATSVYWAIARKYNMAEVLPDGFAIQGEIVGPGIQGNPMGLDLPDLRIFNAFKIGVGYADFDQLSEFCQTLGWPMVHVLAADVTLASLGDLQRYAEGVYANGAQREGIVIRPLKERIKDGDRVSVKVLNLLYKEA